MNDVSERLPLPWTWPPASACATRGSAAAASRIELLISVGIRVNRIDRKAATPMVPPICRQNVTEDEATPLSCGATEVCTARITGWKWKPRPTPSSTMNGARVQIEVSAPTTTDIETSATTMNAVPTSGKILYFPVFEMATPELIAPAMMPATSGIIWRPATVALDPCTICRYCG